MPSRREAILDAAKAALTNITGVNNANIYRSRNVAFARAEHPAVVIEPVQDNAERGNLARLSWTMLFQATAYVRADIADESADTIVSEIHSKIMNDATLNAAVVDLVPVSVQWGLHDADQPLGVIAMQFQVVYQTNTLDITS